MESNSLSSFLRILRESLLIFLKNKSIMASIALFVLLLHSFLFSCNFLSIEPLIKDFFMNLAKLLFEELRDGSQSEDIITAMTSDFHHLAALEWFFILALAVASLFSSAITVSASAVIYAEEKFSLRDLLATVFKSCKRLIITWFYISLFDLGYFFLAFALIFPFALNFSSFPISFHPTTLLYVVLFLVSAFYMYLGVVWNMSLVVSVLEEKSGVVSFGKAWKILKGFKLQGFLLNLLFGVPSLILNIWWDKEMEQTEPYNQLLMSLILVSVVVLMKMLLVDVAFTVLYRKCKLRREEEDEENVELQGSLEYSKVASSETTVGAEIP